MKKEDIHVTLDEGDLVISGESKTRSEVKKEDCYRLERSTGQFYRRLALPFEASANRIEADFKDGVLEVKIPRPAADPQRRRSRSRRRWLSGSSSENGN